MRAHTALAPVTKRAEQVVAALIFRSLGVEREVVDIEGIWVLENLYSSPSMR